MARARTVVRNRGARRLTEWGGLADQGFVSVASAGSTLISSQSFVLPGTIVRSRGNLSITTAFGQGADLDIVGAFGIGLVSSEALAIGITAVPTPFRDADWGGWMVWRAFAGRFEFADATGFRFNSMSFEIDSKAMRKVGANTALVFVAESQAGAFSIAESIRTLQMLH